MLKNIRQNLTQIFIYVVITTAIIWTDIFAWLRFEHTLPFGFFNPFFYYLNSLYINFTELFSNIVYGRYLANKFFLIIIAFLILGYWLFKNPQVFKIVKQNWILIALIGLSLIIARFFSFERWFYHDDFRLIADFYNGSPRGTPYPHYPLGIFNLVTHWFRVNYSLYNALALFFYFLNGVMIFTIGNILQPKKYISFLAAVFFVTTPTYWGQSELMNNMLDDGFVMLIFFFSWYLLLRNFLAGSIIFAAAALEFGIARTQFIAAPLVLSGLFFLPKIIKQKSRLLLLLIFPIISFAYLPVFLTHPNTQIKYDINILIYFLKIFGDLISGITIPFIFNYIIVWVFAHLLNKWQYITIALGYFVIFSLALSSLILHLARKRLAAKLFFLGLVIIVTVTIPITMVGVRVDRAVEKFVEYNLSSIIGGSFMGPRSSTGYGYFQAIGLALIIIAIGTLLRPRYFKVIMFIIIISSIITDIYSDRNWVDYWGRHNRRIIAQVEKILPRENKPLYIYTSSRQRFLWQGIGNFQEIFRTTQPIYAYMGPEEFTTEIQKVHPAPNQLYLLVEDGSYNIYNYSDRLRTLSQEQLNSRETLMNILTLWDNELMQKYNPK